MTTAPLSSRVSACVVNHQGRHRLDATLSALTGGDHGIDEVVLVDSGSTDRSIDLVRRRFPSVRIVALSENRGPAVARNRGFEAATHDLVLFVDNDVIVGSHAVRHLVHALERNEGTVLALPRVLFASHPARIQFEGADAHFLGLMSPRRVGVEHDAGDEAPRAVGSMVSACFLLDRARWGDEPPFDESFGFNYEDHDFGVRCSIRGLRMLAVPAATCLHGEGTPGLSLRGSGPYPPDRAYHLMRGRWVILLKCFQLRTLLVLLPALIVYEAFQVALVLRRGWMREWVRAGAWVMCHYSQLLDSRREVQRGRRLPDRAFLVGGRPPFRDQLPRDRVEGLGLRMLDRMSHSFWSVARRAI